MAFFPRELMINPSCLVCRTCLTTGDLAPDSLWTSCQAATAAQRVAFMSLKIRGGYRVLGQKLGINNQEGGMGVGNQHM